MKRRADTAQELSKAVASFWNVRERQKSLRANSGERDQGSRDSVTSGKQMDGFVEIIRKIVLASGLPVTAIHTETKLELPGYFRPEKKWDLAIIDQGALVAIVEFKSQVSPAFGNHFNNRTEESIGSAQDLWGRLPARGLFNYGTAMAGLLHVTGRLSQIDGSSCSTTTPFFRLSRVCWLVVCESLSIADDQADPRKTF